MKKWNPQEDKIITDRYKNLESFKSIASDFNVSEVSVKKRIYRVLGGDLVINRKPHLNKENADSIICLFNQGYRTVEIGKILNLTRGQMVSIFSKFKIKPISYYTEEMKVKHISKDNSAEKSIYRVYVNNSTRNNVKFELTIEDFGNLIFKNCHYCDSEPEKLTRNKGIKKKYNGIDKKYPKLGYVLSNCVPCCWECNRIKSDIPYDKFLDKINKIYNKVTNR